ncbi:type II toxin-antitoxin system VapC family toxin [Paracoccus benzoatiresistens]|uniref:Type II toxin-antitoxin system VapC family toxin n=1 Tax=Paracoccus benzoatiresistens TaxID=2997341 RepID=A0ABT4J846_9RHOB|nr:type II toxin-antitoxin system VapC family toxin [Paracoccus sp. EF6]MCZ0963084.1 type II toxin-antitoxin system VapC family toxin [Paracoccus sp. EF6]
MFLDASVVAAVLLQEEDGPAFLAAMEAARGTLRYSPVVRLEAVLALVRKRVERRGKGPATAEDFAAATAFVDELLQALEAEDMPITASMGDEAIRALSAYGKMVGHPAQLNMGDALSYACAKACHGPLLYKGNDFSQIDLA